MVDIIAYMCVYIGLHMCMYVCLYQVLMFKKYVKSMCVFNISQYVRYSYYLIPLPSIGQDIENSVNTNTNNCI